MRAIAEYSMKGQKEAIIVATVSAAIPLMFWVSAAAISLIVLRKGWAQGLAVLFWAVLPASAWLVLKNDPTPILVIAGSAILAYILRTTVSWTYTLFSGVVLGLVISWLMPLLLADVLKLFVDMGHQFLDQIAAQTGNEVTAKLKEILPGIFSGVLASAHLLAIIASLILGRWWQSLLYNPGGFKTEFHQLILPKTLAVPLFFVMAFGGELNPALLSWIPILAIPFMIAGIALVHGVVGKKKMSVHWLVAFYVSIFFIGPYLSLLIILMASLDSIFDFRARIKT